ncbi:FLILHELTA domain containing protein [Elaphomyces granulatus]
MSLRSSLNLPPVLHLSSRRSLRRFFSTSPPPPKTSASDPRSRLQRLNERLPAFLRRYTAPLIRAPVTHITSFLILHEITAVVPLFGLVAAFHYGGWMPDLTGDERGPLDEGLNRFGRWLRKKGWVEERDVDIVAASSPSVDANVGRIPTDANAAGAMENKGTRLIIEFATAYAITKALLPIRIVASVWATPWFARVAVGPLGRGIRATLRRAKRQ